MDTATFLSVYGRDRATEVAHKAGTNWQYFYQIANGYRRPSVEKAQKLVEASNGELSLMAMLTAKKRDQKAS